MNWNLAIVQKLNYGNDNLVRSAVIKTKSGVTNRPIRKLYPLEVRSDTDISLDSDNTCENISVETAADAKSTRSQRLASLNARQLIKIQSEDLQV